MRLQNVSEAFLRISHIATASRSTRSRIRFLSPFSVTMSISRPRNCRRSFNSPPMSNKVRPGSISTKKSISLFSSASSRATDPITRIGYSARRVWRQCSKFLHACLSMTHLSPFLTPQIPIISAFPHQPFWSKKH